MESGTDCGNLPWVVVEEHVWHYWQGAWAHYPYHCPPCQVTIGPASMFLADVQEHFDCDGHLMRWNGSIYEHANMECDVCQVPGLQDQIAACQPGRAPTQEECDAALAGR